MSAFYPDTIARLDFARDAKVLVVCGGELDRDVFRDLGFRDVTISNVDERMQGDEFAPYPWSFQDAEYLGFADNSFDYVVVHAGLHHCASPHRALLEMYRVARKGVVSFEARDSGTMRLAKRLGLVPDYELFAVRANGMRYGGVRNSCVPNYVYRWTEEEVRKTIASYAPHAPHRFRFFYGLRLPSDRLPFAGSRGLGWIPRLVEGSVQVLSAVFPKQRNLFAFYVEKPAAEVLMPWLKSRDEFDPQYAGMG